MLQRKLYLQHTIDVYVAELAEGKFKLTFHRMTTRERIEIITSRAVAEFLALLNGKNSVEEILKGNLKGNYSEEEEELLHIFIEQQVVR